MELFFDTETTGIALFKEPHTHKAQPNIVQLGAILSDEQHVYAKLSAIITPQDVMPEWTISEEVTKIHGITEQMIRKGGIPTIDMLLMFKNMLDKCTTMVCHNIAFDKKMMQVASVRGGVLGEVVLEAIGTKPTYCTMERSTNLCKLPGSWAGKYKWPKLVELYKFLFNETLEGAHDALVDVMATRRCFYELKKRGL